jgi:hypothetical protein
LELDSSSATSDFFAISVSDFNISKLTSLLHTTLAELKSFCPALAEVIKLHHLMQPTSKIDEVVEYQRDIRPLITEMATHCAAS